LVLNLPDGRDCLFLQTKSLILKRFKKILKWFFLSLLLLLAGVYIFVQTPFGQNWLVKQVTKRLSHDLNTEVKIDRVDFALFNKMHLQGVLIRDRNKDTLMYAGDVKVRITDWFFFKKKAELKYIGLENAIINFTRTDSVWNQQFFFDYFSSPTTGGPKKKASIEFNLKTVDLKNVIFSKKDKWVGQDMILKVGTLNLEANDLSLAGNTYDVKSLVITDPIFAQYMYAGRRPAIPASQLTVEEGIKEIASLWNPNKMDVRIASLSITNGTFKADRETPARQPYSYFDGQHVQFDSINATISNAKFLGDTIFSNLKLTAKERSGLVIKKLDADLKLMPTGMAFSNLDLQTNRSTIRNYFEMNYKSMADLGDFIHKVRMAANFDDSYIDSDDLGFFAPTMNSWRKKITLKGKVRGTVDDLVGRDLIVQAGNSTFLNGDITLTGLPDINQTFIDFKANDFRTTYADAVTIVPSIRKVKSPDLAKLRYVNFRGSFTGFIRDFVTYGTISTNLGVVKSDLNMKLPYGQPPVYSGNISTDNFQLGAFLGEPQLGAVSLEGVVKGRGIDPTNRNAEVRGNIRYIDFRDYRYHNIVIEKGKLDKNLFDGAVSINDENAELTLNGLLDFNAKTPTFKFLADIKKANLKTLNLTKEDLAFNGKFDLDFTGDNIDNFLGNAHISGASITRDGNRLPFDSLSLTSSYVNNIKTLTARSNEFEGSISGDFNIAELPDAVQLFLNKYYPAYVKPPRHMPVNESFQFDFTTQFVEDYVKLIDSSLTGFNYSHIFGSLDLSSNQLNVQADVPYFKYKNRDFSDVKLTATGTLDSLVLLGEVRNIYVNDSINIPLATFRINSANDVSKVTLNTGANQTVDRASINAIVTTYNDGVKIDFDRSDFVINGKTWSIDESGELQFRTNTPASGQLVLREGEQEIRLKTIPSSVGNWNDLLVDLKDVNLGDFSPYFLPKNRLEGLISGNLTMEDPTKNLKITSNNIETKYLRLDNDSLGALKATVAYDNKTKELKVNGKTLNEQNYLEFDADLFFGSKEDQAKNIIALKPRNFQLSILERFLGGLFSDIEGYLTGAFDIKGDFSHLNIVGKGRMKDAGLKINFTQCFYRIQDTDIELKPKEIDLDGLVLEDPTTGNPIYVEGSIEHDGFKDMFFAIDVSTQKKGTSINRPVLLLNTTINDNKQFFGQVSGTGSFTLTGPQSEMFMGISAVASTEDSSYITIPSANNRESGIADFLVERKYGREMSDMGLNINSSNIIYDVDVTANPMLNVRVVLDDLTGDVITGRGTGTLNIHSGTSEPLRMRGRYDIEEGSYTYNFQSVFKKPFEIKKEFASDNYIEWTDDPYHAKIHFDAVYTASRVSFTPLATLPGTDPNIARARGDVYVIAKLTDDLFKPTINFALDFPVNSPALTDPGLNFSLKQLQTNPNEINTQVTYLIVFNSFAPPQGATGAGINISSFATSTISGIFLDVINDQLNKILSKLLKNDKYLINLNTAIYNRDIIDGNNKTAFNLGSNVNFSIGRSFFNDRFIITAGGGFDAPLQQSSIQQSIQLLPDVTMEWLINQSGTLRASFFYRENTDYFSTSTSPGRARRYGGSLTYKKEFNSLKDLFRRKSKRQPEVPADSTTVPAAVLPEPAKGNE
jgi:hypothetical protein